MNFNHCVLGTEDTIRIIGDNDVKYYNNKNVISVKIKGAENSQLEESRSESRKRRRVQGQIFSIKSTIIEKHET